MGYTHYLRGCDKLTEQQVKRWVEVTNRVITLYNKDKDDSDKIVNCGEGKLVLSNDNVRVNGHGDNGHETLYITKEMPDFEFCKTAQKPYDEVVVASYYYAGLEFDCVKFTSDGDKEEHKQGIELLSRVFRGADENV